MKNNENLRDRKNDYDYEKGVENSMKDGTK